MMEVSVGLYISKQQMSAAVLRLAVEFIENSDYQASFRVRLEEPEDQSLEPMALLRQDAVYFLRNSGKLPPPQ
jgi:hypothetical protein